MTTAMRTPLHCQCGHSGYLILKMGDPERPGREFSLDGFTGDPLFFASDAEMPESLLGALAPSCPVCGQSGRVRYEPA